jgi:hypothetical protein
MDEDRPDEPIVERVERADGRYILYFSWRPPADQPEAGASAADEDAHE